MASCIITYLININQYRFNYDILSINNQSFSKYTFKKNLSKGTHIKKK